MLKYKIYVDNSNILKYKTYVDNSKIFVIQFF